MIHTISPIQKQMEEPKERLNEPEMSNNKNTKQVYAYNVACSPRQHVKKDIAESLYQVLSLYESDIIQKIHKCKKDIIPINNDIMWLSSCDYRREWKKQHIKDVEKDLGEVDHESPITSVPRTDVGFFRVTRKDPTAYPIGSIPSDVGTDKKRCHNRLNKGRMDLEYSKQVQEELLILKESDKMPIDGAQELNYVMESLVHRVQHGNNKRADEAKLYHEIRNVNDAIDIYTEATRPDYDLDPWGRDFSHWRPNLDKRHLQSQLKIVLSQLEKARTTRKGQLIHRLDLLRKDIKSLEKELEKIISLRKKACKCAYKHGEQQNERKSSSTEYQSLMTYVKELARRGDTDELIKVCHMQLF